MSELDQLSDHSITPRPPIASSLHKRVITQIRKISKPKSKPQQSDTETDSMTSNETKPGHHPTIGERKSSTNFTFPTVEVRTSPLSRGYGSSSSPRKTRSRKVSTSTRNGSLRWRSSSYERNNAFMPPSSANTPFFLVGYGASPTPSALLSAHLSVASEIESLPLAGEGTFWVAVNVCGTVSDVSTQISQGSRQPGISVAFVIDVSYARCTTYPIVCLHSLIIVCQSNL